jgi:hypothetical protein
MTGPLIAENVFKPRPSKNENKANVTDHAYRTIVSAETDARLMKTERLKAARRESQARVAAAIVTASKAKSRPKGNASED